MDWGLLLFIIESLYYIGNVLFDLIVSATNWIGGQVQRGTDVISGLMERTLVDLASILQDGTDKLIDIVTDQLIDVENIVGDSEGRITDSILQAQQFAESSTQSMLDRVSGLLLEEIGISADAVNSNTDQGISAVLASIDLSSSVLGQVQESILGPITDGVDTISDVWDVIKDGMSVAIQNVIDVDESIFGGLLEAVVGSVRESLEANAGFFETVTGALGSLMDEAIRTVGDMLGELHPELKQIWQTIFGVGERGNEIADKRNDRTREGTGAATTRSTIEELEPGLELTAKQLQSAYVDFVDGPSGLECLTQEERDIIINGVSLEGVSQWILNLGGGALAPFIMLASIAQARARRTVFRWAECNPTDPLPPGETVLSFQRGFITADEAASNLKKRGWSADDAERIINVGFTAPDLALGYAMWLRDEIDDDAFDHILDMLGYAKSFQAAIKELAFFIPPVQDLITMAVREVFTPEIAEAQGQFEDFPPAFAAWSRKQGVSEEWARNYWAAHWALPSVQMGFEMLHRDVIDEKQLEQLLRALDVMPGWREPLTKISFVPFTRVDIRRMHRVGVLDEKQVLRAYKDIGYDDEKAQVQLEFVLAANADDETLDLDVASDLTRSAILSFYADGIIARDVARNLLGGAGINAAAAELFLLGADFDIERRERKQQVGIVLDRFRFIGQSLNESADQIRELGLESRERELALLDLERLQQQQTKLPSKADLDKFLGAGLIDTVEYVDQLERQGYSPLWSGRYLALVS